jgi:hypothetical protein
MNQADVERLKESVRKLEEAAKVWQQWQYQIYLRNLKT